MEYVYKNPEKVDQTIHTGYYGTADKDYSNTPEIFFLDIVNNLNKYTLNYTKKIENSLRIVLK